MCNTEQKSEIFKNILHLFKFTYNTLVFLFRFKTIRLKKKYVSKKRLKFNFELYHIFTVYIHIFFFFCYI